MVSIFAINLLSMQYLLLQLKAILIEHLKNPRFLARAHVEVDQIDEVWKGSDVRTISGFHEHKIAGKLSMLLIPGPDVEGVLSQLLNLALLRVQFLLEDLKLMAMDDVLQVF